MARNERFVIKHNNKRWDDLYASQSQSSALENQPSASQSQPSVGTAQEPQTLRKEGSIVQRVLSEELTKITGRKRGWVDNGRILSNDSPEVKTFLADLRAQNKNLHPATRLCIHAKKTKQGITVTTQGTIGTCREQSIIMTLLESNLIIDNEAVKAGESHENDHICCTNVANISNLRHSNPIHDRALTVKLPYRLHSLRTHNPVDPFDLTNLTRALPLVLEPIQKADTALWEMEEHKLTLANYGLTSEWLSEGPSSLEE